MPNENVQVRWQVANDEKMGDVVAHGTAVATPEMAHSIHVEVPGLVPDRWYFYRFIAAGESSPIGRARTVPRPEDPANRVRFAFASCSHWEQGYFTAYHHMSQEDLDLVAHLGDYIYESAGRENTIRKHVGPLLENLDDYRNRHAQYRTDVHLQAAHAKCPWIVTWDDHEFANNCAGAISEKPDESPEQYLIRRAHAYKAYYEHMPLRATSIPRGPNLRLYRNVSFGKLVQFSILDTRQYRTDQPCGDGTKPPCEGMLDEKATLLGPDQERWLLKSLEDSKATWNVLTQQVMMARVDRRPGEMEAYSMDQWPGYEVNRQRLLKFFAEHPKLNPVVIAGDIHSNWVNDLHASTSDGNSPPVGTEFVGTSISSGGDGTDQRPETPQLLSENPFLRWNNYERGYVSCEIDPKRWSAAFRTVPFVTRTDAPIVTRKTFHVEAGKPGAQEA